MYTLYAGDHREPDVPCYRGRADDLGTVLWLLDTLQRDIKYDWWYVIDNQFDHVAVESEHTATRRQRNG